VVAANRNIPSSDTLVRRSNQRNQLTCLAGLTRKGYAESLPPTCSQNPCRQLSRCTGIPGSGARGAPVQRTRARIRLAGDLLPAAIEAREWNVFLTVSFVAVTRSAMIGKTEADVDIRCIPLSGAPLQPTWGPPLMGSSTINHKGKSVFCETQAGKKDRIRRRTSTLGMSIAVFAGYLSCSEDL
jgi:hypothetical protein